MTNWKKRVKRDLLVALVGGFLANSIYLILSFTTNLHSLAVKAWGPAIRIVNQYIDPTYSAGRCRYFIEISVSVILYVFWILVILIIIDLIRLANRRRSVEGR